MERSRERSVAPLGSWLSINAICLCIDDDVKGKLFFRDAHFLLFFISISRTASEVADPVQQALVLGPVVAVILSVTQIIVVGAADALAVIEFVDGLQALDGPVRELPRL